MPLDWSFGRLQMRSQRNAMGRETTFAVPFCCWYLPNCLVSERNCSCVCHGQWDVARRRGRRQRSFWLTRICLILFRFWLVFGSPIDLRTSLDGKELRFQVLDTSIPSESCLRRINRTYSSEVVKAWSTVSCEAFKLYKVNIFFLASPLK